MRITRLRIENFRSIKNLSIEGLDKSQVVIEGPNDVGKSNLIQAIDLAFSFLPQLQGSDWVWERPSWLKDSLSVFRHGANELDITVGIRFGPSEAIGLGPEFEFSVLLSREATGRTGSKVVATFNDNMLVDVNVLDRVEKDLIVDAFSDVFRFVSTERVWIFESLSEDEQVIEDPMRWKGSNLKQMLFYYKNSPDLDIQERFEQLRTALRDPELNVGNMNVSVQSNRTIAVRTRQHGLDLDIEQRGSGIQQLVSLLALTLCHRGRILAVEEPEMNLSEPNQRLLWKKLREFTGAEGPMDQVFITSHSRVFEEEAERLIVSRDPELGTQVRWAEPVPEKRQAEDEVLHVSRGGLVTLPADMLMQLGIQEEKNVYLVPTKHGYQLLGPQGYADHLMEDGSDADSAG